MYLEKLNLYFFRNYKEAEITLKKGINILIGDNAQGKTNLLESIYFLGMTKSHRSFIDESLINNEASSMKIMGVVKGENLKTKLEIKMENKKKSLKVDNNEIKNLQNYLTNLRIIIFFPDDLNIIKDGPEVRRKYINTQISQLYKEYIKVLNDYTKLLKTRNEYILKMKYRELYNKNYYEILNEYFINKAVLIYRLRNKYISKINEYIEDIFFDITGLKGLSVKYTTNIKNTSFDSENLNDCLKEILNTKSDEEISYGKTIYGPHRDEFEFMLDNKNLKLYGSQGQQRAAILSLKLSEIKIFQKATNENPILLLDDVFSELDEIKKNNLIKYINSDIQVIITSTDLANINQKLIKKSKIFRVENGKIESIKGEKYGTK